MLSGTPIHPTSTLRSDDPYAMVRAASMATRDDDDDDDSTTPMDSQPTESRRSPRDHYELMRLLQLKEERVQKERHNRGPAQGPVAPPARECTFSGFMKCNPIRFHGNKGAVGLCRWIEKTKMVFSISHCAEENKVRYAAATFQDWALTWWNSQVSTLGIKVANGKS
ncbi:hypothetical protein Tco_1211616 [Tanacetum coccineum]